MESLILRDQTVKIKTNCLNLKTPQFEGFFLYISDLIKNQIKMKNIFLTITLLAASFVSAQGNGDIVMFDFVRTTPGEQYNVILNEKWKELAQKRVDEGTITGWDAWWRANATSESDWNLLLVTVAKHPDSLYAGGGVNRIRPGYSEMDIELFNQKNNKARTIVATHVYANKGLNFAGNQGETPKVPGVAVINPFKTDMTNDARYEQMENRLNSGDLGNRLGWGLLKRIDNYGEDLYNNYMTVDFYEKMSDVMLSRIETGTAPRQMQEVIKMRKHQQSIPLWLGISVRPKE